MLSAIEEQVRFARRRFGRYEVIDFVAVLFGYAISGERTLEAFYEHLQPWADAFMALFGRDRLPARSTLSRFLAALDQTAVESLRTLFLKDGLSRPLEKEAQPGGLFDRQGNHYLVFDVDGTREAARQRALPQMADQPAPQRRLRPLCAPGYTGRKRGEVMRSRTTILQAHTHQFLGTFGNQGLGEYRVELRLAVTAIQSYLQAHHHPEERVLLRLDGQYGTGAVMADLAGLPFVTRHPQSAFTASNVVALYLHRGAFENALADEDQEQDPDRWVSHAANGQEAWQIVSQWLWNLRLELGHVLEPTEMRTTEFAPALSPAHKESPAQAPVQGYGPAAVALPWKAGRFSGQDFALQPDGTLRCPASQLLVAHEQRREADGSLRVVYAASIRSCRPCPLREQCQWNGSATAKPEPA